jgi:succinate dehydrogenase/fumarate reductase iron-sulfur protein
MEEFLTIEVLRSFDGEKQSSTSKYKIPRATQMTVLAALQYAREHFDSSLVFNYSCEKQRCGSCSMKIDGKISLACFTPARDGQKISPLPGFKIVRDLVVDWTPYELRMRDSLPVLSIVTIQSEREEYSKGSAPQIQSISNQAPPLSHNLEKENQKQKEISESASTCIRCFSCVGACPTVDVTSSTGFAGPALSVMLAAHIDQESNSKDYVSSIMKSKLEYCTRCYACNAVCPASINIVGCIQEIQKIAGSSDPNAKRLNQMVTGYF